MMRGRGRREPSHVSRVVLRTEGRLILKLNGKRPVSVQLYTDLRFWRVPFLQYAFPLSAGSFPKVYIYRLHSAQRLRMDLS